MIALVASGMNQVNAVILDRMQSQIPLIPELSGHLIASGGKRMRPMLTLATCALLDYPARANIGSPPRLNLFTPQRCCMMMLSIIPICGGVARPPMLSGAILPACWSGISSSAARLN